MKLTGPEAIELALSRINLDDLEAEARGVIAARKKTARPRAVRLLRIVQGMRRNNTNPADIMLKSVPVIPPQFRPFSITGSTFLPGDANELYRDVMEHRRLYAETEKSLGRDAAAPAYNDLAAAVRAAYGYGESPNPKIRSRAVKGFLETVTGSSPKTSFYQSRMLSKPVDTVGRGVIIPDADYGMDDVGIPEEMAWPLFGSHVQRRMVLGGMSPASALRHLRDRTPQARQALEREMPERPVVLTRSPAWHRTNVVGQYAKIVPGDAIRINTYITGGQNADFDGDQCINQIFACISEADVETLRMSYHNLAQHEIRFPSCMRIPHLVASRCYIFDLEDFPAGDLIRTKDGKNGRIDFHSVSVPVKVLSYDETTKALIWADVSNWSKHYDREIEIVDTHNGYQIVTDDDPRAVYGTAAGELSMRRFTPGEALRAAVLLPRAARLPEVEVTTTEVVGVTDAIREGCGFEPHRMHTSIKLTANVGWLLGAMAGDGWVIKHNSLARGFAFADDDGRNVARLQSILPEVFNGSFPEAYAVPMSADEVGRLGDTVSYRFSSALAGRWFRDLIGGDGDETTAGSGNKHLPPFFMSAPEEFRHGMLSGLLDTDGSISVSSGKTQPQLMASMLSTSLRLVQEARLLAGSLGIRARITPTRTPKGKPAWMLTFSNGDIQRWGGAHMTRRDKADQLAAVPAVDDSPVTAKYDIVPMPAQLAHAIRSLVGCPKLSKDARRIDTPEVKAKKLRQNLHVILTQTGNKGHAKFGAISRSAALEIVETVGEDVVREMPQGAEWLAVVHSSDVTWERVVEVQKTGIRETGYDLTVPGYETFMSADGVILSNTMSVHVPATRDAVNDVREKLMASRMQFSIKNRNETMGNPKHEDIIGLTMGQFPGGKARRFASEQEAMHAIDSGQVDLNDDIEIGQQ